jgi:putative transport protein
MLVVAPTTETLAEASRSPGSRRPPLAKDRSDPTTYASSPAPMVVGRAIGDLELPSAAAIIAHVRRGDTDIMPRPDLVLEFGDRVGLLANRGIAGLPVLRRLDQGHRRIQPSPSVGLAISFLIGAIQLPIPGIGKLAIGLAGVLVVALVLGNLRRTGVNWTIPLGQPRAAQPRTDALPGAGRHVVGAEVRGGRRVGSVDARPRRHRAAGARPAILIIGLLVYRMPYDEVAGIVAGACGNPAILAYANKLTPTERPDIGYAMIFPGTTIIKILFVDVVPALLP